MIVLIDPVIIGSSRAFDKARSYSDDDCDSSIGEYYVTLWNRTDRDPGYGWSNFIRYVSVACQ